MYCIAPIARPSWKWHLYGSNGVLRLECPACGGRFRASAPALGNGRPANEVPSLTPCPSTVGPLALRWRGLVLIVLQHLYWSVTALGALCMIALGGFIPILGRWLRNELDGWSGLVSALGGIWFRVQTNDPDSDLGPVLARVDAPLLFDSIESVARRVGVRPPGQVRLTYLPCCGVVAWGDRRR